MQFFIKASVFERSASILLAKIARGNLNRLHKSDVEFAQSIVNARASIASRMLALRSGEL
jgi:hypothetical protein